MDNMDNMDITDKNEKIYIIIHGFAGGFQEIEPLYDFLSAKGLNVHSILLAGHGGTRKELKSFSYSDWINSAVKQVKNIKKKYDGETEINLIGFSMGGLICANLTDFFDVQKIAFVNTPFYFWDLKLITKNIFSDVKHKEYTNINRYVNSTLKSPAKAMINFLRILRQTKEKFSSVCIKRANPIILQCIDDDTVQSKSAEIIKDKIGESAKIIYYETGGHLIFLSETCEQVCNDIYEYLKE